MKLYKTTLFSQSNFATSLRGDTMFGHICWAIVYAFGKKRLQELLNFYEKEPFLIVSDGFVSGYLPKPKMPSIYLGEDSNRKKENRKKKWLTLLQLKSGAFEKALSDEDIKNDEKSTVTMHNSLDYKTFKTSDDGSFAPYGESEFYFEKKDIYFLIDSKKFKLDELKKSLEQVSLTGYGKDATIGKGRFSFLDFEEVSIDNKSKTFMSLSPFSPFNLKCEKFFYEPFTRFGRFGGERAFKNAFKKPILMADCASVIHFENPQEIKYIGKAITNISNEHTDAVHQGYSIVVPIKELD